MFAFRGYRCRSPVLRTLYHRNVVGVSSGQCQSATKSQPVISLRSPVLRTLCSSKKVLCSLSTLYSSLSSLHPILYSLLWAGSLDTKTPIGFFYFANRSLCLLLAPFDAGAYDYLDGCQIINLISQGADRSSCTDPRECCRTDARHDNSLHY